MIMTHAQEKHIPGFIITNIAVQQLRENSPNLVRMMFPLRCDVTAIKTAARTNPTLYLVKQGTIVSKWGEADFDLALLELQKVAGNPKEEPPATDSLNTSPMKDSTFRK
jgi:hypothetical protein